MCMVSMIIDYPRRHNDDWWDLKKFQEWEKLIEKAREFDKKTGEPDCEDPEKLKYFKRIEDLIKGISDRLDRLEAKGTDRDHSK